MVGIARVPTAFAAAALFVALAAAGSAAAQATDWLALCAKCMSPGVTRSGGFGTANAWAEARISRADAQAWCDSWQPGDRACAAEQLASLEAKETYRASADCTKGKITAVDGQAYAYAGVWSNDDIGGGRSKWRGADGRIVGRDNASGGLSISQQWEVLCPKGLVSAAAAPLSPVGAGGFAVGQAVEARYMSGWVRGRITRIRPDPAGGVAYDVTLENGQRGVVPPRMLRLPPR